MGQVFLTSPFFHAIKFMIDKFRKEYYFLSNFYVHGFYMYNKYYATSEHAYQAFKAKTDSEHELVRLQTSAKLTKQLGQLIPIREDWQQVKKDVMLDVLRAKFKDKYLAKRLKETGTEYLKEGNVWHDQEWGNCTCGECKEEGKNYLGELLMKIRDEI